MLAPRGAITVIREGPGWLMSSVLTTRHTDPAREYSRVSVMNAEHQSALIRNFTNFNVVILLQEKTNPFTLASYWNNFDFRCKW